MIRDRTLPLTGEVIIDRTRTWRLDKSDADLLRALIGTQRRILPLARTEAIERGMALLFAGLYPAVGPDRFAGLAERYPSRFQKAIAHVLGVVEAGSFREHRPLHEGRWSPVVN